MMAGMDDKEDMDDDITLEAMSGLSRVLAEIDETQIRAILINIALRIRPCFEKVRFLLTVNLRSRTKTEILAVCFLAALDQQFESHWCCPQAQIVQFAVIYFTSFVAGEVRGAGRGLHAVREPVSVRRRTVAFTVSRADPHQHRLPPPPPERP